mmetsp:Transcript_40217/g.124274  ORF Transcript_40217/g.124274 Transcript_40217/m.124274 type:complete len:350 (-) Transcript_40217:1745-2794(-)
MRAMNPSVSSSMSHRNKESRTSAGDSFNLRRAMPTFCCRCDGTARLMRLPSAVRPGAAPPAAGPSAPFFGWSFLTSNMLRRRFSSTGAPSASPPAASSAAPAQRPLRRSLSPPTFFQKKFFILGPVGTAFFAKKPGGGGGGGPPALPPGGGGGGGGGPPAGPFAPGGGSGGGGAPSGGGGATHFGGGALAPDFAPGSGGGGIALGGGGSALAVGSAWVAGATLPCRFPDSALESYALARIGVPAPATLPARPPPLPLAARGGRPSAQERVLDSDATSSADFAVPSTAGAMRFARWNSAIARASTGSRVNLPRIVSAVDAVARRVDAARPGDECCPGATEPRRFPPPIPA